MLQHRFDALAIIDRTAFCERRAFEEIDERVCVYPAAGLVGEIHFWRMGLGVRWRPQRDE